MCPFPMSRIAYDHIITEIMADSTTTTLIGASGPPRAPRVAKTCRPCRPVGANFSWPVLIFGSFWVIFGPFWQFWVNLGNFGSFLACFTQKLAPTRKN